MSLKKILRGQAGGQAMLEYIIVFALFTLVLFVGITSNSNFFYKVNNVFNNYFNSLVGGINGEPESAEHT